MLRKVKNALPAEPIDMGGMDVRQALPTHKVEQIDPFILFHHGVLKVDAGSNALHSGVGPHPHRGFSPVTIVLDGEVHHRDSLGNSAIVGRGGFQWVNAARGIVHSERPSVAMAAAGGAMEMIQLWINTPSSEKLVAPSYINGRVEDLAHIALAPGADMYLAAGQYRDAKAPITPKSELVLARIEVQKDALAELTIPSRFNLAIYVAKGKGKIEGFGNTETKTLYHFMGDEVNDRRADEIRFTAAEKTTLILMAGVPIGEPLATYGPFVMNTQSEIMEAINDYNKGKMGILVEE